MSDDIKFVTDGTTNEETTAVPATPVTVQQVAQARKAAAQWKERAEYQEARLQATPAYQELLKLQEAAQVAKTLLAENEAAYRAQMLAAFEATGEKKHPGGQVKTTKSYEYDEALAVTWALEHGHTNLLKVDASGFKKDVAASDRLRPDFVRVVEKPRAELASDLSEFLEGE